MRKTLLKNSTLGKLMPPISIYLHDKGDYISDIISESQKFYEEDTIYRFARLILMSKKEGCFIDVGCNIGNHSILLSKLAGFKQTIMIDPVEENICIARKNNPDAIAIKAAATSQNGYLDFYTYEDNYGAGTIKELWDKPFGEGNDPKWGKKLRLDNIKSIKIDSIVSEEVLAIKIDVEGAEKRVLEGAVNILKKYKPIIWIEMHNDEILKNSFEYSRFEITNTMYTLGYKIAGYDGMNFFFN